MTESFVVRKRTIQGRTKVKTGCATCRKRRIKCDEDKPFCQRCVGTGRTCDGYESPFRLVSNTSYVPNAVCSQPNRPILNEIKITPEDIELLGRYFSTKTMFDVELGCNDQASQILRASLTDPAIRFAVSSLRALRENLETSGGVAASVVKQTPSSGYNYGLQQYCMALGGLASKLSSPGSTQSKSALFCCQIFISIEQVRGNYAAMAQHMIQGLSIMHEFRARSNFVAANKSMPELDQIPQLDVFIIKLFAAPCMFADPPASVGTTVAVCPMSPHQQPSTGSHNLRTIAPDMRTELTKIASKTLQFLATVSNPESGEISSELLFERAYLLDSLQSWLVGLETVLTDIKTTQSEPLSVSFMRFFHQILEIVLLSALNSSSHLVVELRTEIDCLHQIASNIEEGLKAY